MPYIRRNESGEIAGVYQAQQHEGQEFLAENSGQFKNYLLEREAKQYKRDLIRFSRAKMIERLFNNSPEKIICIAGETAIDSGKTSIAKEKSFADAIKALK